MSTSLQRPESTTTSWIKQLHSTPCSDPTVGGGEVDPVFTSLMLGAPRSGLTAMTWCQTFNMNIITTILLLLSNKQSNYRTGEQANNYVIEKESEDV